MLKDIFGRAFKAGQTVVYPNRHENDLWLVHATVLAVNPDGKNDLVVRARNARRNSRVSALRRVAIIPRPADFDGGELESAIIEQVREENTSRLDV